MKPSVDLSWYFQSAESEACGMKSNFGDQMRMLETGFYQATNVLHHDVYPDERARSRQRFRDIHARLLTLSSYHVNILYAAHGLRPPNADYTRLGVLAPIVMMLGVNGTLREKRTAAKAALKEAEDAYNRACESLRRVPAKRRTPA